MILGGIPLPRESQAPEHVSDSFPVHLPVVVSRPGSLKKYPATMTQLSSNGCTLIRGEHEQVGEAVLVQIDGLEPQAGSIAGSQGEGVAVRFDRSLYPPVVEHYARTNPPRP